MPWSQCGASVPIWEKRVIQWFLWGIPFPVLWFPHRWVPAGHDNENRTSKYCRQASDSGDSSDGSSEDRTSSHLRSFLLVLYCFPKGTQGLPSGSQWELFRGQAFCSFAFFIGKSTSTQKPSLWSPRAPHGTLGAPGSLGKYSKLIKECCNN